MTRPVEALADALVTSLGFIAGFYQIPGIVHLAVIHFGITEHLAATFAQRSAGQSFFHYDLPAAPVTTAADIDTLPNAMQVREAFA